MKKYITYVLAAILCFSSVAPSDTMATSPSPNVQQSDVGEEVATSLAGEVELTEQRTATSKVFLQEDGLHRLEIASEPIHVKDKVTNKWELIDNYLVKDETGRFNNKKSDYDASFAPEVNQEIPLASIEKEGKTVKIEKVSKNGKEAATVIAEVQENRVTYPELYPNTDLSYTVGNGAVKEDIVLKEQPVEEESLAYTFQFDISGLTLHKSADGWLYLHDAKTNERLFSIEKPFMMDTSIPEGFVSNMETPMPEGAWSDRIEVEAVQKGNLLLLTLNPDMEWLLADERVYPVTIDPTVKIYQPNTDLNDTTIRSALPDTTGGADLELAAGLHSTSGNIVRSLLKFDMGTLPKGARIMNAQLNLRLSSVWNTTSSQIGLYEMTNTWEENLTTWQRRTQSALWTNKGGDFNSTLLSSQTVGALDTTLSEPPLVKWGISADMVQKWMDSPSQNLGLMLKATNESLATYKKFYSGDATGNQAYTPKLTITYYPVSRLGLESYWSYFNHSTAYGQGSVNVGTGNLVLDFTDFAVSGRGNSGFAFNRTFNSKAVEDSPLGYGWSFSGSETVSEFPSRDVLYQDADGTAHLFTFDAATNKYNAPAGLYFTLTKASADAFVLTDNNGNRTVFRDYIRNPELQSRIYRIEYEEDRNQNKITYWRASDDSGRLTAITDATGRTLALNYQNGRVISISFEGTKKVAYSYDTSGRLTKSTVFNDTLGTTGSITSYQYNLDGELSAITDANGQITNYLYENGYLKQVQQPDISDASSDIAYDYTNLPNLQVIETDARGNRTAYKLNSNYSITSVTDPMGNTSSYTYDSNHNMLTSTDPKGSVTTNSYDAKGNLTSSTDSLGNKISYTYNSFSQPLTMTDANGTVQYSYNSYGDLVSETTPLGDVTSYTYDEPYGNLKNVIRSDGSTESFNYDANQNYLTQMTDALNRVTSAVNDKYGNVTRVIDAKGNSMSYQYDEQNRLTWVTDANGVGTAYTYDANGNLTTVKNGNGQAVKLGYNSQNQFVSRTEPLGQTTSLRYDAVGNLVEVLQPNGTTAIRTEYDANNRPTIVQINAYMKWEYGYDQSGNTVSIKDWENGAVFTFTYDGLNQLKAESNGKQQTEYSYSPTGAITTIKGSSGTASFSQTFRYNAQDQLTYVYRNGAVQVGMDYTSAGLLAERRHVNGVQSFYSYDAAQQLQSLKINKGTTVLLEETNAYDLNGNLVSVTTPSSQKAFSYDKLNQLVKQTLPGNGLTESYTYDAVGNRLSKTTVKNGVSSSVSYGYNANNQLVTAAGQTYTYDASGNRLKDGKYTYTYDKFSQLTAVKTLAGATVASYKYDDQGRRISKTAGGKTTFYHYDQGINVLFETDSSGMITAEYSYDQNNFPLTLTIGNQTYYYVYNSNQEITGLTDAAGTVVASYSYDAWGNILSQSGSMASENPFRYKRYRYDEETMLYYLIARYYQPTEAVFLMTDPVGGDSANPDTQNGYNYVSNNPLSYFDGNGEKKTGDYGGASGGWYPSGGGPSFSKKVPAKTVNKAKAKKSASDIVFSDKFKKSKYKNQVASRGWTKESIAKVINNPYKISTSVNKYTRNKVVVYYKDKIHYVAVDKGTGKVIQVSDLNKSTWVFDPTFTK